MTIVEDDEGRERSLKNSGIGYFKQELQYRIPMWPTFNAHLKVRE
jgi:hypothetical protein